MDSDFNPEILFEDKKYIFVIKPVGVLSEAGDGGMVDVLSRHLGHEVFPVHRLDRAVGGAMVYAKNRRSAAVLSDIIAKGQMTKEYMAVVRGEAPGGIMEDFLFKDSRKNKSYVVKKERRGVKKASLEYVPLEVKNGRTLVKIKLHTGRSHQIRVQFSSRKLPLLGDGKYGGGDNSCSVALWSYGISFIDGNDEYTVSRLPLKKYPWSEFDLLCEETQDEIGN